MTESLWRLKRPAAGALETLRLDGGFPHPLDAILAARGYRDVSGARAFLNPDAGHDPLLLNDMDKAVGRLIQAWRSREKVAVFGDYDVDGVTGAALLSKLFGMLGMAYEAYLPDRGREGYGLNAAALEGLKERGASVVVTVDCGITSVAEARRARELGLDLLVTDHHLPGPELPAALALVNPRLSPSYPYGQLVGVAVAYKLAEALLRELAHPRAIEFLDHMLELVALGTVCDVAPLDGENRVLTRLGVERLRRGRWLGLRSLAAAAGLDWRDADAGTLGFQFGPRLNAGGRVGDAMLGLRLLLGKDADEAARLAARLDALNRERRDLEKSAVDEASRRAEAFLSRNPKAPALVLWDQAWHAGVVGLVAARLLERFLLPVFIFAVDGETAKGSGRARSPLRLADCLQACSAHLLKFGGHEAAAGATARVCDLPAFAEAFAAQAALAGSGDGRVLDLDLEVAFRDLEESWMGPLAALEPHGRRNPRPLFLARGLRLGADSRPVGADGAHLKLSLAQGARSLGGIAFGQGPRLEALRAEAAVDAAFHLSWNVWQGRRSLQVEVKELRASSQDPLLSAG